MAETDQEWRETGEAKGADEAGYIDEYDIAAIPNDFNVLSIVSFINAGSIKIPGFQRNYVWDLPRASRLIESLILGLPVPQVFLYQKEKDLLLIDGQQRLMTIYYFVHGRFPKREARVKLRDLFDQHGKLPETSLQDDALFSDFKLSLKAPDGDASRQSPLHGKKYATLGDDQGTFNMRTIRNVVIKQIRPTGDHSSMFEVFNRLNSGGVNLSEQELRMSLYDSDFLKLLLRLNRNPRWRQLVLREEPDVRFRDVEVLLRAFGLLLWVENYRPSMARFLNRFAAFCEKKPREEVEAYARLFEGFLKATEGLDSDLFAVKESARFNVILFESVFAEWLRNPLASKGAVPKLDAAKVAALDKDPEFRDALLEGTTKPEKMRLRLERARAILLAGG